MDNYNVERTKAELKYARIANNIVCSYFKIAKMESRNQTKTDVAARRVFIYLCGLMNISDTVTSEFSGTGTNSISRTRLMLLREFSADEQQRDIDTCESKLKDFFSGNIPVMKSLVDRRRLLTRVRRIVEEELPVGADIFFERELKKVIKQINMDYGPAGTSKSKPYNIHNG